MSTSESRREIQFEQMNLLGKTLFVTDATIRTTASLIDAVLARTADLVVETEKAFREGLQPPVEDAKILQEWDERRS